MPVPRLRAAVLVAAVVAAAAASAQVSPHVDEPPLATHAYTLRHQPAAEALALVRPLLSPRGSVELQPRNNTLVIRDSLAAVGRIVAQLRAFDHPARLLRLEILVLEAGPAGGDFDVLASPEELPAELLRGLRALFKYEAYRLLARANLEAREGEQVAHEFTQGFRVDFRLGTLLANQRVKLHDFRMRRSPGRAGGQPGSQLIHTNLNLGLAQPFILGLARDEASQRALLVGLECVPAEAPLAAGPR
jgi:hypothetical protein